MTRLQAFATRVTRAMLEAFWAPDAKRGWDSPEARAVLEREVKALFADASVPLALAAWMATFLDQTRHHAPPPRRTHGATARR